MPQIEMEIIHLMFHRSLYALMARTDINSQAEEGLKNLNSLSLSYFKVTLVQASS